MDHIAFGLAGKSCSVVRSDQANRQAQARWLGGLADWTHALTLTMAHGANGHHPGFDEVLRRCKLFLNRVNCRWYKRRGTKRGYRIASTAFLGWGAYGDHPHVHWALEKPLDQSDAAFEEMLIKIAQTTSGIHHQIDVQRYYGPQWLAYMLDHGFEFLRHDLTFAAKCPKH